MASYEQEELLRTAAENGNAEEFVRLLKLGAKIDATIYGYGWTALKEALEMGHMECVKVLLHGGADVNKQNKYGWTALMMASEKGHMEIVKVLLHGGADVNKQNEGLELQLAVNCLHGIAYAYT